MCNTGTCHFEHYDLLASKTICSKPEHAICLFDEYHEVDAYQFDDEINVSNAIHFEKHSRIIRRLCD